MYRAVALKAFRAGLSASDARQAAEIAETAVIGLDPPRVTLDGEDVTEAIRTLEVGQMASELSTVPAVRRALVAQQQSVLAGGGYVLEGRDTTTVVAPHADLKVFLTASIEERARRRWLEIQARGESDRLQEVVVDVVQRDHRDYSRADSPLTLAEDAVIVETFGLTPDEVAERVLALLP